MVLVLVLAAGVGGASACLVVLATLVVVAVVVVVADRGDGGCPRAVAVVMRIDESGGCRSVPSLKVNECRKRDRGVYFHVVEDIRGKMTIEFQASEEVDDEPGT